VEIPPVIPIAGIAAIITCAFVLTGRKTEFRAANQASEGFKLDRLNQSSSNSPDVEETVHSFGSIVPARSRRNFTIPFRAATEGALCARVDEDERVQPFQRSR
jgi:hypothetical protein